MKARIKKYFFVIVIASLCLLETAAGIWIYHGHRKLKLREPVYGGLADTSWSGDRLYLGSYEQDNNRENGTEPILWRVLSIDGERVLLLSEYALDCAPYNDTFEEVTWETCTVRCWLNGEFYERAFENRGAFHKEMILDTECVTQKNQIYGTDCGNCTTDKVFLLAWEDTYEEAYGFTAAKERKTGNGQTMKYAGTGQGTLCYPTLYAASKDPLITRKHDSRGMDNGDKVDGIGSVYWILRTSGKTRQYIQYVSRWGRTTYDFLSPVDHTESCIRPAVWVDLSEVELERIEGGLYCVREDEEYVKECKNGVSYKDAIIGILTDETPVKAAALKTTDKRTIEELSNPVYGGNENGEWEGDRVYFGKDLNGNRALWRVLSVDDTNIMLLSEFGIRRIPYDKSGSSRWDTSTLRQWMNQILIAAMFDEGERSAIKLTYVKNDGLERYGTSSGEDTKDRMFLLSYEECMEEAYGFTKGEGENSNQATESMSRICYCDEVRTVKEIYGKSDVYGNQIYSNSGKAARWWLRTAGFNQEYMSEVNFAGDAFHHELMSAKSKLWVRPVIVLDKTKLFLEEGDERFPVVGVKGENGNEK